MIPTRSPAPMAKSTSAPGPVAGADAEPLDLSTARAGQVSFSALGSCPAPSSRGSKWSRSPSPSRLNPSTARAIATPGQSEQHAGKVPQSSWDSWSIRPQDGFGGRVPKPEERQRGLGQHGEREGHRALHDQHARRCSAARAGGRWQARAPGRAGSEHVLGAHHLQRAAARACGRTPGTVADTDRRPSRVRCWPRRRRRT